MHERSTHTTHRNTIPQKCPTQTTRQKCDTKKNVVCDDAPRRRGSRCLPNWDYLVTVKISFNYWRNFFFGNMFSKLRKAVGWSSWGTKSKRLDYWHFLFFVISVIENSNILTIFFENSLYRSSVSSSLGCVMKNTTTLHSSETQEAELSIYAIWKCGAVIVFALEVRIKL